MAEIALSVFSRQVLRGRIGDEQILRRHIGIIEAGATIEWRFRSQNACTKLNHICPETKL